MLLFWLEYSHPKIHLNCSLIHLGAPRRALSAGGGPRLRAAERSYPTSDVRGRSWKDPMPEGRRTRGVSLCPRSGVTAERSHPAPEARGGGWEEPPHAQGAVAALAQEGLEQLSHVESQEGRQ